MVRTAFRLAVCAVACSASLFGEVSGYARTGMANSLTSVISEQPSGRFTHAPSGTAFTIRSTEGGMVQRIERNGLAAEHVVAYVIGSGNHAFGYLVRAGDYLFQSPVSYYSKRKVWDMAPGYEQSDSPDFARRGLSSGR